MAVNRSGGDLAQAESVQPANDRESTTGASSLRVHPMGGEVKPGPSCPHQRPDERRRCGGRRGVEAEAEAGAP